MRFHRLLIPGLLAAVLTTAPARATVSVDAGYGGDGTARVSVDCTGGSLSGFEPGPGGRVYASERCSSGYRKVLVHGPDGTRDASFSGDGAVTFKVPSGFDFDPWASDAGTRFVVAPDGSAMPVWWMTTWDHRSQPTLHVAVKRVTPSGSLTGWGTDGIARWNIAGSDRLEAAVTDSSGRLLVAVQHLDTQTVRILRLTTQGKPDPTFSGDGVAAVTRPSSAAISLTDVQSCMGRTVLSLSTQYPIGNNTVADATLFVRLGGTGALDPSFNGTGRKMLKNADLGGWLGPWAVDSTCRTDYVVATGDQDSGVVNSLDIEQLTAKGGRNAYFAPKSAAITRSGARHLFAGGLDLAGDRPVLEWRRGDKLSTLEDWWTGLDVEGSRWTALGSTGTATELGELAPDAQIAYQFFDWSDTGVSVRRYTIA